jgi:hypothetical protein
VWHSVFAPRGITARQVLLHKTGKPLTTVVQLVIDTIASARVPMGEHALHWCQQCERPKYLPFVRGCFPSFRREVVIDRDLYSTITAARLRGCHFLPVCSAP